MTTLACVSPKDRFDEFNDRVIDAAPVVDIDGAPLAEIPDITGEFLMGISPVFAPAGILQFRANAGLTYVSDNAASLDLTIQALRVDDRTPVGAPTMVNDIAVNEAGEFEAVVQAPVDGEANPLTGADLNVDIILHGTIRSTDVWCGTITGMELNLGANLDGSTFAAIRIAPGTPPSGLPEPVTVCPAQVDVDAGVPDASPADATPADADVDAI